jgi:multicomponent Na+:H+ antiporter subunit F
MHDSVLYPLLSWLLVLIATLALRAARARNVVDRLLMLDTLALIFIAALSLLAIARRSTGYLDVALMLALLSFAQTVASARYAERRKVAK